jgi:hypothetical protein
LIKIPASKTEPATGASTWAKGSQIWNGNLGIFTAKLAKNPRKRIFCTFSSMSTPNRVW